MPRGMTSRALADFRSKEGGIKSEARQNVPKQAAADRMAARGTGRSDGVTAAFEGPSFPVDAELARADQQE
jgi:hypothetical protein